MSEEKKHFMKSYSLDMETIETISNLAKQLKISESSALRIIVSEWKRCRGAEKVERRAKRGSK